MHLTSLTNQQLFKNVPVKTVEAILGSCPTRKVSLGEAIIIPGCVNHSLYIIVTGRLGVRLDNPDSPVSFPILPGECIGEMSIIENRLTSAWVIAEEPCELIVVPEELFWDQIVPDPVMMRNLLQMLTTRMRRSNQVLMDAREQQLRYEQMQKELDTAGKIQANILPDATALLPNYPQVDLHAWMNPAKEVGGDFYDAFALDANRICVAIGDVSGKGMPAALFMVRVMTLLRMSVLAEKGLIDVLARVNKVLCEHNPDMMFVTIFVGVIDVNTGLFQFSNGGHNAPLAAIGEKVFKTLSGISGMLLGVYDAATYPVNELVFHTGDTILLYTDGVTEAENPFQEQFTLERAIAISNQSTDGSMEELIFAMNSAVNIFSAGAVQSDDVTLLGLRLLA